jgi:hypothetical protein
MLLRRLTLRGYCARRLSCANSLAEEGSKASSWSGCTTQHLQGSSTLGCDLSTSTSQHARNLHQRVASMQLRRLYFPRLQQLIENFNDNSVQHCTMSDEMVSVGFFLYWKFFAALICSAGEPAADERSHHQRTAP